MYILKFDMYFKYKLHLDKGSCPEIVLLRHRNLKNVLIDYRPDPIYQLFF